MTTNLMQLVRTFELLQFRYAQGDRTLQHDRDKTWWQLLAEVKRVEQVLDKLPLEDVRKAGAVTNL